MFPSVAYYLVVIARVTGTRRVFPFAAYGRVLALAAVSTAPAIAIKLHAPWSAGAMLAAEAGAFLATYAAAGTLAGLIDRGDWRFLRDWILVRRPRDAAR
jgi:hypothetical protein